MKSKFYKIYIVFSLIILAGFAYSVKAAYITTPDTTWTLSGSNLFPVSTSYSVGIGTTSPAHPLDVNGNILARGSNILFADLGATNREYITSNDSGISGLNTVGVFGFFADTSLGGVITSPTAGISAKGIYSNGYVGIGIASPNKQLHVYSTNPNAEIDIQSVLGAGNQWGLYNEITDNSFRIWGGDNYVSIKRDGKIGIGTLSPSGLVDLYNSAGSNLRVTGSVNSENAGSIDLLEGTALFGATGSYGARLVYEGVANRFYIQTANNTTTSTRLTIARDTGNVGINTGVDNPLDKLHVVGNVRISGVGDCSGSDAVLRTDASGRLVCGTALSGSGTTNYVARWTGTNTLGKGVLYDNGTNVGIGTTNPGTSKLSIEVSNSNTNFDTSVYPLKLRNMAWLGNQVTGIEFWNGAQKVVPTARIISQMNGSGAGGENLHFQTQTSSVANPNPNQPTTKFSILANGNVGIGTTNPQARLDLGGGTSGRIVGLDINPAAVRGDSDVVPKKWIVDNFAPVGTGAGSAFVQGGNSFGTKATIGTNDAQALGIETSGAERMTILSGGNVGIGNTNPSAYKLDVIGSIRSSDYGAGGSINFLVGDDSYLTDIDSANTLGIYGSQNSAISSIKLGSGGGIISGYSGNIGIGTTNPGAKLTILGVGTANTPMSLIQAFNDIPYAVGNGVGAARIEIGHNKLHGYIEGASDSEMNSAQGYLAFGVRKPANSISEAMRIASNGNVGIGTVAPGYKLDTYTPNTLDAYLRVQRQGTTKPVGITLANDTVSVSYLYMPAGRNDLRFYTGGDRMTILNSNGNVGIGVTNPGAKLDVNGGIRTNNQLISTVAAGTPPLIVTSNTVVGNLNADMLDGQHYSNISDTIDSKISVAKSTNFGYRYAYDLWIYGETDKYYPFVIYSGDQNVKRDILIKRSYSETHPAEWNTATHGGGLTLKIKTNFGGWGGANYSWEIHELEEMYNSTFGGAQTVASYMGFAIFLRGGGPGGAIYHVYSDQPIEGTHPVHIQSESGTTGPFPVVYYNSETVQYGNNPSYTWVMPTALSTPDVEGIRIRKFIPLTQSINSNITSLSNNYIPKRSGSYFFANSLLFDNGTNLGIGTTSPQVRLHLGGDENTRRIRGLNVIPLSDDEAVARKYLHDNFAPIGTGAGSAFVQGGNSFGTKATLGTNDSQTLAFETAGAERMTILSGGNVGIGVTNPIGKLEIATSSSVVLNNSSLVGNYHLNLFQTSLNSGEGAGLAFTVFGSGDLSNSYTPGAAITFDRVGNNSQGGLHFKVKGTAGATDPLTDALFIKYDSNVGIGTTNPQARLDLGGGASGRIVGIDTNPAAVRGDSDVVPKKWIVDNFAPIGTGAGSAFVQGGNSFGTKATLGTNDSQTLAFETAGAERMTILSNGNVGIGITNPGLKLDVVGGGGMPATSGTNQTGILRIGTSDTPVLDFGYTAAGQWGMWMQVSSKSNLSINYPLILNPNGGSVGVGTTVPGTRLDVQTPGYGLPVTSGNSQTYGGLRISPPSAAGNVVLDIGVNGGGGSWLQATNRGDLSIEYPLLLNPNGGNVGIGTASPGYKLDTYTPNTLDAYLRVQRQGTTKPVGITLANGTVNTSYIYMPAGRNDLRFYTGGDRMTILNSNGYVGIGTTGPTEELHVIGDAKISASLYASGASLSGNLLLNENDITGVNKLTVMTIDPLYRIKGINYSTFAPSFVGGVKEEIAGKIKIEKKVAGEYQAVIDFSKVSLGSDLWVWYNVIDFNKESVEVLLTPYGGFANTYYYIDGKKLVLKADRPVEVSYRLIAKRFDWKKWPTKATDQNEKPGFILD